MKKSVFLQPQKTGYSVVRLSRLLWEQEVASSNLAIPTEEVPQLNWIEQLPSKQQVLRSSRSGITKNNKALTKGFRECFFYTVNIYNLMKRILFAIILNCCAAVIFAQDVIIMWDATEIEAKVLTIGVNDISYKKCTFQDGPTLPLKQAFRSLRRTA